jgi:glycosyltransferase involved in cell wall biosynthesis
MSELPNPENSRDNAQRILVCIPAFNEAREIGNVVLKAKKYAQDVIVCDDGSTDNTGEIATDAGATVLKHDRNYGYGRAIRTLFQEALLRGADVIVTMDSDGQHDASQIPTIVKPIIELGLDIVIGSRFMKYTDKARIPFYRSVGIKTITKLTNQASYKNLTDAQSGFRGYSRRALESMNLVEDGMKISTEILLRSRQKNLTIKEVPITISYDVENSSTHNFLTHGFGILFSVLQFISLRHPLLFYALPGVALLVVSGVFAYSALDLFSSTRFISINMVLISISAAIIGIVLLTTGNILFTIAVMLTQRTKTGILWDVVQFISLRHPLLFYALPGIALLLVSGVFAYYSLDFFSSSRYVTVKLTNLLFVMISTATIGIVFLTTGSVLITVAAMLKGRIRPDT